MSGIQHKDISLSNITYWTGDKGEIIGVLHDWDLATLVDARDDGLEPIGTMPFMALDLLLPDSMAGSIERLYRHDLEALFWVLVWAIYPKGTFVSWESGTYSQCYKEKEHYLIRGNRAAAQKGSQNLKLFALSLSLLFKGIHVKLGCEEQRAQGLKEAGMPFTKTPEETPQRVWQVFCKTLRDASESSYLDAATLTVLEDFLVYADTY